MKQQTVIPGAEQIMSAASPPRDGMGRFVSTAKSAATGQVIPRQQMGQGEFSPYFASCLPKIQDPMLYETLREAIPILDTAIRRYCELDGLIHIECSTDALQRHADEWAEGVVVNDLQQGFQAAFAQWRGEIYEQGFGAMEYVADEKRRDIVRLLVPDSKSFWFEREKDGAITVWFQPSLRVIRNMGAPMEYHRRILQPLWNRSSFTGFDRSTAVKLNLSNIVIGHNSPENSDPHGVSILRSVPFVSKTLATINNAVMSVWERFGDPSYFARYKSGAKNPGDAKLRDIASALASDIASVMSAKRAGRSADLSHAIGKDDDLEIKILGGDGQVLTVGEPGSFTVDQIVSGTGLSYTLLGLPTQSANEQAAISSALYGGRLRFELYRPLLRRPVAAMFALRGVPARPGDWTIKQEQPNYDDVLKLSQARFMDAQRIATSGIRFPSDPPSTAKGAANGRKEVITLAARRRSAKAAASGPDPVIADTSSRVEREWLSLGDRVLAALGLPGKSAAAGGPLTPDEISRLTKLAEGFVSTLNEKGGYVDASIETTFDMGLATAAAASRIGAPLLAAALRAQALDAVKALAFEQVKNKTFTFLQSEIIEAMGKGTLEGQGPQEIARWLHSQFEGSRFEWARLIRTELAAAHNDAKAEEWNAEGKVALTAIISNPSCPICGPKAGTYPIDQSPSFPRDTHPNCVCDIRPATKGETDAAGLAHLREGNTNPNANLLPEDINP